MNGRCIVDLPDRNWRIKADRRFGPPRLGARLLDNDSFRWLTDRRGALGRPDELGPALRALGVSLFTVGAGGPDYDLSKLRDWIAWRDAQNP